MREKMDEISEKTCLITGATSGIGKVVATELAKLNGEILITGRNPQKLEAVSREIKFQSGNSRITYFCADFSDLEQVRKMAEEILRNYPHLDILINNAGAYISIREMTKYGVEKTFLVNHLAPFLLTNLLMQRLQTSAQARIINISSDVHQLGSIDFDNLGFDHGYFGLIAYARSKLANILFTYELARRINSTSLTVNSLHPGHVVTNIWNSVVPNVSQVLIKICDLLGLTLDQGADNTIFLTTSAEVARVTGKYFVGRKSVRSSSISYDESIAKKLWDVSCQLVSR